MSTDLLQKKQGWSVNPELTLAPPTASGSAHLVLSSFGMSQNKLFNQAQSCEGVSITMDGDRKRKREWNGPKSDLFGAETANSTPSPCMKPIDAGLELHSHAPLPPGWEQCLDLESGKMFYVHWKSQVKTNVDPRKDLSMVSGTDWKSYQEASLKENLFLRSSNEQQLSRCVREQTERVLSTSSLQQQHPIFGNVTKPAQPIGARSIQLDLNLKLQSEANMGEMKAQNCPRTWESGFVGGTKKDVIEIDCTSLANSSNGDLNSSSNYGSTMVAAACRHCHMFVMLSRASPQCPNCRGVCAVDQYQAQPVGTTRQTLTLLDFVEKFHAPNAEG